MAKLKNAIFGLSASGSISGALTYLKRMRHQIVEKKPELKDQKTAAQLSWRHMFLKVVALWHALSAAEKLEWESLARPKHMTGYAWFVSQALRPNPGIYLPLQGGKMSGSIDMDGNEIEDLPDPVNPQDADTEAARDAAIAAALAGSLTVDIHGWDGAAWQKLLTESAAQHNLRVKLFDGTNGIDSALTSAETAQGPRGLQAIANNYVFYATTWRKMAAGIAFSDAIPLGGYGVRTTALLTGYNGATWDRLRSYGVGILKVGRAEVGLNTPRHTATGQVKAASGSVYWIEVNPSAGMSLLELSDDLDGLSAVVYDCFHTTRESHMHTFDPPMEFSTGIRIKTFTSMTSIIIGYL